MWAHAGPGLDQNRRAWNQTPNPLATMLSAGLLPFFSFIQPFTSLYLIGRSVPEPAQRVLCPGFSVIFFLFHTVSTVFLSLGWQRPKLVLFLIFCFTSFNSGASFLSAEENRHHRWTRWSERGQDLIQTGRQKGTRARVRPKAVRLTESCRQHLCALAPPCVQWLIHYFFFCIKSYFHRICFS